MFLRWMAITGPKPSPRRDSDRAPASNDFSGLERLDRPELDEDAPPAAENAWEDESAVKKVAPRSLARSA